MESKVSPGRVLQHKQSRFNPIRGLTPDVLARQIEAFNGGDLRALAMTMDAVQNRDDVLKSVIPKRKSAAAKIPWEVVTSPGLSEAEQAEAERHKEALVFFYENLTTTDAFERNKRRGFSLLVEQMMDAVAKRYSVHEILWQPSPDGLTATFNHVPLWLFENRTGELRYLKQDFDLTGQPLEPGGWLVTVAEGVMEACVVAYMFKHLCINSWLDYCERSGAPGIKATTAAPIGSDQYDAVVEMVEKVGQNYSVVVDKDTEIEKIDFTTAGTLPYPGLIERMDRMMAAMWRGADLSTISAGSGDGAGASLQGKESDTLESADAQMLTETLNAQVDIPVLRWHFGDGVKPLAYVRVAAPPKKDVTREIQITTHLVKHGVPVAVDAELERFGRERPDEGVELLKVAGGNEPGDGLLSLFRGRPENREAQDAAFANESKEQRALMEKAIKELAVAQAADLKPLTERLSGVLSIANEDAFWLALANLKKDLPNLLRQINKDPMTAQALETATAASLFNGAAKGGVRKRFLIPA